MKNAHSRNTLLAFLLVIVVLLLSALLTYYHLRGLQQDTALVTSSYEILNEVETIGQLTLDAESAMRGYLLVGNPVFLEPYHSGRTEISTHIDRLGTLTSDNSAQQELTRQLGDLIDRRLVLLQRNIDTFQNQGADAATQLVAARDGRKTTLEILQVLHQMKEHEQALLKQRVQHAKSSFFATMSTSLLSTIIGVLLAALAYFLVQREISAGVEIERGLQEAKASLEARVQERTASIQEINKALHEEIEERQRATEVASAAMAELQRSNRELEQFASVASHDLQEPLRKIQAFGDRLAKDHRDQLGDKGQDYLDRVLVSASRMRTLIDDLLAFSRISTKAQPFATVDLRQIASEVVGDLEGRLQREQGTVELGELPQLEADPVQMRQLLQNLIGNGLKFRKHDVPPVVRVSSRLLESGDRFEITVADNGIGFEQVYANRIFELFQRLHGRNEFEGTGMGLAICRKIVERHGGTISAQSSPGKGAVFAVVLPASPGNGSV